MPYISFSTFQGMKQETPTPLRMMADPMAYHIHPSRKRKADTLMPPPPPRKGKVISEEEFESQVTKLITRDFYPDLPKLRLQAVSSFKDI
jgi:hypothetical protein